MCSYINRQSISICQLYSCCLTRFVQQDNALVHDGPLGVDYQGRDLAIRRIWGNVTARWTMQCVLFLVDFHVERKNRVASIVTVPKYHSPDSTKASRELGVDVFLTTWNSL